MSAAAAAAAQAKRLRDQEEEEALAMSMDTGTFEYKIIRSATAAFKHPGKLRAVLEEEAQAGWDLMEKLDDTRVRLRRPIQCRNSDADLSQDPYRTWVGISDTGLALGVLVGLLVVAPTVVGLIVAAVVFFGK